MLNRSFFYILVVVSAAYEDEENNENNEIQYEIEHKKEEQTDKELGFNQAGKGVPWFFKRVYCGSCGSPITTMKIRPWTRSHIQKVMILSVCDSCEHPTERNFTQHDFKNEKLFGSRTTQNHNLDEAVMQRLRSAYMPQKT